MSDTYEKVCVPCVTVVEPPEPDPEAITPATSWVFGNVANCEKLNIRKVPSRNGEIITVIPAGTEVMISMTNSTSEWYNICTCSGIEGFCMKQYIQVD